MILLDTSVLIPAVRGTGSEPLQRLVTALQGQDFAITRVTELELLQGARDEDEWSRLQTFLAAQEILDPGHTMWLEAARIRFELRRKGVTIASVLDCCIAQIAMARGLLLVHNDSDFEKITGIRPLKQQRLSAL